jgi:hypothetical protein
MENNELQLIKFSQKERKTLPFNHLTTYAKDIPGSEAYALAELHNSKFQFKSVGSFASKKPISKIGVDLNEYR